MSDIAIKIENLSKVYQLGDFSTGTLSQDIERWWTIMRGKEDPFLKLGEENNQTLKGVTDVVWSLKDINFEIDEGDVVGIIGRNGAGKSTLLKILSRVTSPTTGNIKVKGRIASLLEVGTGFHPELTGRENIFLNGAILGMRKAEIKKHFDAIVDFAGIDRYLDTPVKRYSSGMYVRLAFAVAAHLESEILIIDEVLAVGDVEFQKKCLGKMSDVSRQEGRTVLFVSHNMAMVRQLCNKTIHLKNGQVWEYENSDIVIKNYLSNTESNITEKTLRIDLENEGGDQTVILCTFEVVPYYTNSNGFPSNEKIKISIEFEVVSSVAGLRVGFEVSSRNSEESIFRSFHDDAYNELKQFKNGRFKLNAEIPGNLLNEGEYIVSPAIGIHNVKWLSYKKHEIVINIINIDGINRLYADKRPGVIAPEINWEIHEER